MLKKPLLAITAFLLLSASFRAAGESRMWLAAQYDWANSRGFYLDFEGNRLSDANLVLGVADGKYWRFLAHRPGFVTNRQYEIRAVISLKQARLFLDSQLVAEKSGKWLPSQTPFEINFRPAWASETGDWLAIVSTTTVMVRRGAEQVYRRTFDFWRSAARPIALQLFEPGQPTSISLEVKPEDTVTVTASVRFARGEIRRWAPYIDRYGQSRYAEWPGKVRGDEDLRGDIAREDAELAKMPPSADFDPYGGYTQAGWREEPTGFFRTAKRNGFWWLVTPYGNPCFYLGVSVFPGLTASSTPTTEREFLFEWLPPREEPWAAAWSANRWGVNDGTEYLCFYACNLIRKYGPGDWMERATQQGMRRLKSWGFSGGGKWGAPPNAVSTPVLDAGTTPRLVRHPDIFDPKVCEIFRRELERQILPRRDDAMVLGWAVGNEFDEIITGTEIREILAKPADTPAKRALLDYALDELYSGSLANLAGAWKIKAANRTALYAISPAPPAGDLEKLRRFYADRYYDFLYRTVKAIDPNHLYLGFWISLGWWENEEDWRLIARHCDVIGYDHYSRAYDNGLLARLQAETDKPALCGEFSFPPWYDGTRGFGRFLVSSGDEAEAGDLYYRWTGFAARDPYCVGLIWFKYPDQNLTGGGPGRGPRLVLGDHFSFGLVTVTDRPKWPLVKRVREANLKAAAWRSQAAGIQVNPPDSN